MSLLSPNYKSLLVVVSLLLVGSSVSAARYTAIATVDQEAFYDSNIIMGSVQVEEVEGYSLRPRFKLDVEGEGWSGDINTILDFTRLSNQRYDSDDQFVDFSLRKFSESQSWQLDGDLDRQSTRSQLLDGTPELFATRTVNKSLRPSWTRVLNEKNTLSIGASGADQEYDSARYSDYEYYGFDANWVRQLNEKNSLQVGLYNSRFNSGTAPQFVFNDSDLALSSSDTVGLSIGLTRQFDEKLSASFSIGTRRVDTKTRFADCPTIPFFCQLGLAQFVPGTFESESDGFTASGNAEYSGDRWSGSVSLGRSLSPSGIAGELVESDNVMLNYSRQLRPKIYFDIRASYDTQESLEGNAFNRDLWMITPSVRWQFHELWSLTTTLRHRNRETDRGFTKAEADGTAIIFRVRYAHPRARWSR